MDGLVERLPVAVSAASARTGRVAERAEYLLDVVIEEPFLLHRRRLGFLILLARAAIRVRLGLPSQIRLLPPVVIEMLLSFGQVRPSGRMGRIETR